MLTQAKAGQIALTDRWFRFNMPYALQRLDDKTWLPVNRNYKPLGYRSRDHVQYEDYRDQAMRFARDPRQFKDIWIAVHDDILYLYDDGTDSRTDYFERLARLLTQKVTVTARSD